MTALRFPEAHGKRIRTTNLLERLFGEGGRRAKVIPRFMNEKSGLGLVFAVLADASASWHGINSTRLLVKVEVTKAVSVGQRIPQSPGIVREFVTFEFVGGTGLHLPFLPGIPIIRTTSYWRKGIGPV